MTDFKPNKVPAEERKELGRAGWKHLPLLCLAAWCAVGVMMRAGPSMTVLTAPDARADFMTPMSGAWALASGLHIHTDFSSPLGLAYFLPYYWMLKICGDSASVVRYVASAFFVLVSVVSFLLLRPPRYSWRITALGAGFISLLASSPGLLGAPPTVVYEGIAYNYLGIAAGYLCLLTALFPPRGEPTAVRRREMQDGLLLAAVLAWITFVKINFLAQNIVLLVAAFVVGGLTQSRRTGRFYGTLAVGYLVMTTGFALLFRVNLSGMFHDIGTSAACRSHWTMGMLPISDAVNNGNYLGLTALYLHVQRALMVHLDEIMTVAGAVLVGLAAIAILGRTSLRRVAAFGGLLAVVLACDVFQDFFNSYGDALPMIPLLWLFLICVLERGNWLPDGAEETARSTHGWLKLIGTAIFICYLLYAGVGHVSAFVYNSGLARGLSREMASANVQRQDHLQAKGWEQLYYSTSLLEDTNALSFVAKINQGMALLRDNGLDQKRVVVFDQINPFPFLLRSAYPVGQPAWMHAEATFNLETHPTAESLLKGADVLLLPKQPLNTTCLNEMAELYQAYVRTNYTVVTNAEAWLVLKRDVNP